MGDEDDSLLRLLAEELPDPFRTFGERGQIRGVEARLTRPVRCQAGEVKVGVFREFLELGAR
jgi:hypothetical protein